MTTLKEFPVIAGATLTTESAAGFIHHVADALEEPRHMLLALAASLSRLSALADNSSEWSGRALKADKLYERYTQFISEVFGWEVSVSLKEANDSRSRSSAQAIWSISVRDLPSNPDNLVKAICFFDLQVDSSYTCQGTYDLMKLVNEILLRSFQTEPV